MEEDKKKKIVIKKKKPIVKVKIKGKKDDHEEETHAHGTTETKETTSESSEIRTEKTSSSENKSTEQRNTYQGNRDNRGGGYQGNRDNRGGGYQGNRDNRGGGYQGNRDNRGGGYQGNRDNRGGGFQNKDGRPNQGGGGGDFRKKREEKSDNFAPILDKKNFRGGDWKNKKKNKEQDFLDREEEEKNFEIQRKQKQMASAIPTEVEIPDTILVKDLAKKMNIKSGDLIAKLMSMGYMATINDALDKETTEIIASEFGCKVIIHSLYDELQKLESFQDDDISGDITRPPVVTVMGHVDHGKTSLLDYIRNAAVAAKEAGGITQHIGAYQVEIPKGKITFIDTPGHEAFTRMRERGAAATDIVILVVAADDGVMPQTIEALNHAKAAGVPIIVAMNKIDKPSANPDRVKQQLAEHDLVPEDWGGKTQFIPVSALKGTGVNELLEAVLLEAEMKELKANPKKKAKAIILEAQVDKGKGPVATIIIKDGTLKKGDIFVAGIESNKVRAMFDYTGKQIKEAPPSMPIEVIGFDILPEAGEVLRVVDSEKKAKEIVDKKKEIKWLEHAKKVTKKASLDDLYQQYQQGQKTDFNIIVKADVQGTAEAIKTMIEKFGAKINEVNLRVLHTGVGAITENDVELASASKAVIIGFNVRPNPKAADLAKVKGVEIRKYSIIYKIVDELKDAIEGVLKPEEKEVILGQLEVRNTFKVSKVGTVAGCYVTEGIVKRNSSVRVIREGVVIHSGKIEALKRFKDDAKEVSAGFECGITLVNFNDIKEKDTFEAFEIQEIAKKLELND